MQEPTKKNTQLSLWKEFLPLSLSDVVMAVADPLITTSLAHLPNSRTNIGAFGVAKSLAVVFESPIIMILHASNVLGGNKESRRALWKFTLLLSGFLASCLLLISLPYVFTIVARYILGIEGPTATQAQAILSLIFLWPFAIGWRRFFQGLLIREGFSKLVGKASIGRIIAVVGLLLVGMSLHLSGEKVAAFALIGGILIESLLVTLFSIRKGLKVTAVEDTTKPHTLKAVWKFYWPLANSSLTVWTGRALLLAIVARSVDGPMALASWTAAWGLVLVVANATRMVQQVVIRRRDSVKGSELFTFIGSVGLVFSLVLLGLAGSSFTEPLLHAFLGGDTDLVSKVGPVLSICAVVPLGVAFQNALQGLLISTGRTKAVNGATAIGFLSLLGFALAFTSLGQAGALAAAESMLLSLLMELTFLSVYLKRSLPKGSDHLFLQKLKSLRNLMKICLLPKSKLDPNSKLERSQ